MTERHGEGPARPLIGAPASVAGGMAAIGLAYAAATGAEAIQVFVANPRSWAAPPGDPAQDAALRQAGENDLPLPAPDG
jgi:deoxyribonuclease-4